MTNTPEKHTSPVRRITIDEKLAGKLIRVLVAGLKPDVRAFSDDPTYWQEEEEVLVRPDDYLKIMGIPADDAERWPWEDFHEGQVFLQGRFEGDLQKAAEGGEFMVNVEKRQEDFRSIYSLSKNRVKKVYMSALERSITDGEINRTR